MNPVTKLGKHCGVVPKLKGLGVENWSKVYTSLQGVEDTIAGDWEIWAGWAWCSMLFALIGDVVTRAAFCWVSGLLCCPFKSSNYSLPPRRVSEFDVPGWVQVTCNGWCCQCRWSDELDIVHLLPWLLHKFQSAVKMLWAGSWELSNCSVYAYVQCHAMSKKGCNIIQINVDVPVDMVELNWSLGIRAHVVVSEWNACICSHFLKLMSLALSAVCLWEWLCMER